MQDFTTLPDWLTETDLNYYVRGYQRTGFGGALNFYRNKDRDWQELGRKQISKVSQPSLFIGGERDCSVILGSITPMKTALRNLRKLIILPSCGHWVQEEQPKEVRTAIIDFLQREAIR